MANMRGQWLKDPAGYCALHRFALSEKDIQNHKRCVQKKCRHLRKLPHAYWVRREERRLMRVERKRKRAEVLSGCSRKAGGWEAHREREGRK